MLLGALPWYISSPTAHAQSLVVIRWQSCVQSAHVVLPRVCDALDGLADLSMGAPRGGTSARGWRDLLGPLLDLLGKTLALDAVDEGSKRDLSARVAALLSAALDTTSAADPAGGSVGLDARLVSGLHQALADGYSNGLQVR